MNTRKTITLPNGTAVSLRAYARAWSKLSSMPAGALVGGWTYSPESAGRVLAAMRAGLHDRINRRGGLVIPPDPENGFFHFLRLANTPGARMERYERKFLGRIRHRATRERLESRMKH